LSTKYISTDAGATARKTVPTNRNRKLEKLVIRCLGVRCSGTVTDDPFLGKGISAVNACSCNRLGEAREDERCSRPENFLMVRLANGVGIPRLVG
jgi:hypothetical protein